MSERRGRPLPLLFRTMRAGCSGLLVLLPAYVLQAQTTEGAAITPQTQAQPQTTVSANVSGVISGEVIDHDGAMIAGAVVALIAQGAAPSQTTSDRNGHFALHNVPPGLFSLSISLPGFNAATESGTLQPGQSLALPQIALSMAVVSVSVNAVTPEQLALEELQAEEHQRLVGVLPNFFVSYDWTAPPLTSRQKFALATHNVLDPGNLALSATVAGVQQAANAFPGYGQGAAGYGKRFGADLANLVAGSYMGGAVLPSVTHQDPRYFYKGTGSKRSRFVYAISRAVITRGDNGHEQPNFSGVLGDLSAAALSNIYYPASDRQGATLFFENGILSIAGDAMNDLVQEFVFNHVTTKGRKR